MPISLYIKSVYTFCVFFFPSVVTAVAVPIVFAITHNDAGFSTQSGRKKRKKQRLHKHMLHYFYCHLSKSRAHYLIRYDSFCDSIEFAHWFGFCSAEERGLEMNNVCILYEFVIYFSGKPFIFITTQWCDGGDVLIMCFEKLLTQSFPCVVSLRFSFIAAVLHSDVHSPAISLLFHFSPVQIQSHNSKPEPIQNVHTWENNSDNYCYLCARRNHNYAFNIF